MVGAWAVTSATPVARRVIENFMVGRYMLCFGKMLDRMAEENAIAKAWLSSRRQG